MTSVQSTSRSHRSTAAAQGADVHVVKPGDTLSGIAHDHGVSLQKLIAANPQIKNPNLIFPGQEVKIPGKHAAPAAAPAPAPAEPAPQHAPSRTQGGARREAARQAAPQRGRLENELPPPRTQAPHARPAAPAPQHAPSASGNAGTTGVHSTQGMSEAQKFDYYKGLIESHGGAFHGGPNARNIVGLRHETDLRHSGANDDKFAMIWQDKNGRKHVKEYTGTTEGAEANRRNYSSDVNGDGSKDMGRIPAGHYEYQVSHSDRLGNVLRPTHAFQVQRDYNHDGKYTGKELHADYSASFLFHQGTSAGCQTMDASNFQRFWHDVNSSGRPSRIGYTLIDA